jgi:uncharacterized membrane protein
MVFCGGNLNKRMSDKPNRQIVVWQDLVVLPVFPILLTIVIDLWPLSIIRVILGLICLLFVPGYAIMAVFFPSKHEMDGAKRIALSIGMSIVVVILCGLILTRSPWGMRVDVILIGISGLAAICCAVAFWRRSNLPPDTGMQRHLAWLSPLMMGLWAVVAIAGLMYAATKLRAEESFTEFYILGPSDMAEGYPYEVSNEEPITLILGIVNHEQIDVQYSIEREGTDQEQIASPRLNHGQKWEKTYTFTLTEVGESQKVTFLLYKGDDKEPHRSLHLWITVREELP